MDFPQLIPAKVACRDPALVSSGETAASTDDTIIRIVFDAWPCGVNLSAAAVSIVAVQAPFHSIAAHVIEAQLIRLLGGHLMHPCPVNIAVVMIPGDRPDVVTAGIGVTFTFIATTGGKLPLRLGGQGEAIARQHIQPPNELLAFKPHHIMYRQFAVLVIAAVDASGGSPQRLGDLGLPDIVWR